MMQPVEMLSAVRAALERHPRVNLHASRVELAVRDDVIIMTGEVPDIVAKRAAYHTAARIAGAERVLDELRVAPAVQHSDAEIAGFLQRLLMQESAFRDYRWTVVAGEADLRSGSARAGGDQAIAASVRDGVVTLEGTVGSLTHRRLADVLAWWTPGACQVRNFLHVVPEEQDSDAEVSDALRIILDKDHRLDGASIGVQVKQRIVTLAGVVASEEQRRMVETDAWYVLGVHDVDNRLQVQVG